MKVFISWSGDLAHYIAIEFQEWLKKVLQASDSFVSSEDIGKGTFWSARILEELAKCNAGVIIVTPQNYSAPWLNFEAGAMVNGVGDGSTKPPVCPLLVDVAPSSLPTPMSLLQVTLLNQDDVIKMVASLSETVTPPLVSREIIKEAVALRWDGLIQAIETAKAKVAGEPPVAEADTETMIKELLDLTRTMATTNRPANDIRWPSELIENDFERARGGMVEAGGNMSPAQTQAFWEWVGSHRYPKTAEAADIEFRRNPELWARVRRLSTVAEFTDAMRRQLLTKSDVAHLATTYGLEHQEMDSHSMTQIMLRHVEVMRLLKNDELDIATNIALPPAAPDPGEVNLFDFTTDRYRHEYEHLQATGHDMSGMDEPHPPR